MAADFDRNRYLVEQLFRPLVNLYRVLPLDAGDQPGPVVAFVRQRRFRLREDVRFYADDSEREELFRLAARRRIDIGGRYDVLAADGGRIGVLEHQWRRSLITSTWTLLDAAEAPVAEVTEESLVLAILRRLQNFVVNWAQLIPIPYNFTITRNGAKVGEVRRRLGLRDRYVLDLSGDTERRIDRRIGLALAVVLDMLQGR